MANKAKPRPLAGGAGTRNVDQAGKQVERPYRSETSTWKGLSLFRQLERLAVHARIGPEFEHFYGERPPGEGWWSPVEEDEPEDHWVRSVGRRRRARS